MDRTLYVKTDENDRVLNTAFYYGSFVPPDMQKIDACPEEGRITDYLYRNGEWIYDPVPPEPDPEPVPTENDRLDAIEAAIMDIASAMYDDSSETDEVEENG